MDHRVIPNLEEHHVGINDLLKSRTNINVSEIAKDIIDIALCCRSHNIETIFISGIVYSTKVSHTKIQKLNELLLSECTKYGFHLVDNEGVFKENLWKDGVHLVENGKYFFRSCKFSSEGTLTENCSGEKIRKDLCPDNQIRLGIYMAI